MLLELLRDSRRRAQRKKGLIMRMVCPCIAPLILLIPLMSSPAKAASLIDPSYFQPNPEVITFETGSTELPDVPGLTLGGGDASFNTGFPSEFFGHQFFGNFAEGDIFTSLTVDFATPQHGVGGYLERWPVRPPSLPSSASVTTSVFGVGGVLLGQYTTPVTTNALIFVGVADPIGISRIEWTGSSPTGFIGVDNVTYGAIVPEPSSVILLGVAGTIALLAFAAMTWCRCHAVTAPVR
jgi:hypothetical protein